MLATSVSRVAVNTADEVNERIRRETEESVRRHVVQGPEAIERGLAELDSEWDIERSLGCSPFFGPPQMEVLFNVCKRLQYRK